MRLGESYARSERYKNHSRDSLYEPHEMLGNYPKYLGKLGVRFRLPILELDEDDVFDALGGEVNPLYGKGFDRVGCFPCLASGDQSKERAFNLDDVGNQRRSKMITFVTVWVLTVTSSDTPRGDTISYQLTYATQKICLDQAEKFTQYRSVTCNFQQVPIYLPKDSK